MHTDLPSIPPTGGWSGQGLHLGQVVEQTLVVPGEATAKNGIAPVPCTGGVCVCMCECMCVCVYVCMCVYMYVYVCECVYVYMCVCVCRSVCM